MVDVSDGLVTDLSRVAAASGVRVDLDGAVLRQHYAAGPLALALGEAEALHQVLSGGEELSLVGVFADEGSLPEAGDTGDDGLGEPWHVIGRVLPATSDGILVTVDGAVPDVHGWDHFAD
jgi:thiamine-monophosphate kinase